MALNPEPTFEEWPSVVADYLRDSVGAPREIVPLAGLSFNRVWRADFRDKSVIVKRAAEAKESTFYRHIAPQLAAQGVSFPALEQSFDLPDSYWLIIEYIPNPLPRERWLADPDVLNLLYHLHQSKLDLSTETPWLFTPSWDDSTTESVLECFPAAISTVLRPRLITLQAESQPLFESECWISGDPNARNWGTRDDGAVVLFDWERFGRGTPAIDLAIITPGLATPEQCEAVSSAYLKSASPQHQTSVSELSRKIKLGKVWNVVEFLDMAQKGEVADTTMVARLVEHVPPWLEMMANDLNQIA